MYPLRNISQIIVISFFLSLAGCSSNGTVEHGDLPMLREYFRLLEPGKPVSEIEQELDLPEPIKRQAPAYDWPDYKYKYLARGCFIYFHVDMEERDGQEEFLYLGDAFVCSEEEYWSALRRKEAGLLPEGWGN